MYILELNELNNVSIYPDETNSIVIDNKKYFEINFETYKEAMNKLDEGYYPIWKNNKLDYEKFR